MTALPQRNRNRAIGLATAVGVHIAAVALLVLFAADPVVPPPPQGDLVAVLPTEPLPPEPPPPVDEEEGAAAPPSRGESDEAPSPPEPPAPLQTPVPAEVSADPGSDAGSGSGVAAGSGAGQGDEGSGRGAGAGGSGTGSGTVTPPVRVAGALTHADYRRADPPAGAAGTVFISFRVRADGSVDRCRVVRSSGFAVFDTATCRLVEQRFRFRPARDARGRAVDYELRTNFTWEPR
jgi:protein TonB